jgi:hypothetical protein
VRDKKVETGAIHQQYGWNLSVCVRKAQVPLWGSLVSCGRLSIGHLPRLHQTAAVANRRAGCQPAPHNASFSTFMSRTRRYRTREQ